MTAIDPAPSQLPFASPWPRVLRCARAVLRVAGLVLAWTFFMLAHGLAAELPSPPIALSTQSGGIQLDSDLNIWMDPVRSATLEQVASGQVPFHRVSTNTRFSLNSANSLWVKLALQTSDALPTPWSLSIPLPYLDSAVLHVKDAQGHWQHWQAGDTIAQSQWQRSWLYPDFTVVLPGRQVQELYLEVRNFKHLSLPIRIVPAAERDFQRVIEAIGLGVVFGLLVALTGLSLVRYLEHFNGADRTAFVYGLAVVIMIVQINGVLNFTLWRQFPAWGDYAFAVLPNVAMGCALLVIRSLYSLSTRYLQYDRFIWGTCWLTMVSVVSLALMPRVYADMIISATMALATLVGLAASLLSWKSRSIVSSWMMAASIPPFLVLMRLMAESFGLVPTMWEMRVVLSVVLAVTVPLLLYALSVVTHDRKEIRVRANHLPTQDALTGLLNAETFMLQLEEACNRVNGHQEKVGVVLVDLVNYELIREKFGDTLGEQCLLRSVVKLQRVLRDMDPAGRMGRARFGLILQGVADKDLLTERMVKLVASGHIPIPGLVPAIALQFQAACALLHLTPMSAQDMVQSLSELLNGMSAGTRRPIRFAETVNTIRLDPPSVPPPQDLASQPVA